MRLAELMALPLNQATERRPETPTIDPLAQADELRDRFARLGHSHTFQPGDIVREKRGLGRMLPKCRTVWIVVRPLDEGDSYDQMLMRDYVRTNELLNAAYKPNLVCADVIRTGGKQMTLDLYSSALLEPVTDAELMAWALPIEATE